MIYTVPFDYPALSCNDGRHAESARTAQQYYCGDMRAMKLEVCIENHAGLDAALAGGADRVEICAALYLGGLSPAPSLIAAAAAAPIGAHMLVRPHDGGFRYDASAASYLAIDIDAAAQAGLEGIVIGANSDGGLDTSLLAALVAHAREARSVKERPLSLTLHRAFDLCDDLPTALEDAIALGFDQVLTSGGAPRAPDAVPMLARLHRQARGRIVILAGSGIDAMSVTSILATGISDIHASCGAATVQGDDRLSALEQRFGFTRGDGRRTDVTRIQALKAAMHRFCVGNA